MFGLLLSMLIASAGGLVELDTGRETTLAELKDKVVVVIERECTVCQRMGKDLKACPKETLDRMVFLSMSHAEATREMRSRFPRTVPMLLGDRRDLPKDAVQATPLTIWRDQKMVGRQTCESLARLK